MYLAGTVFSFSNNLGFYNEMLQTKRASLSSYYCWNKGWFIVLFCVSFYQESWSQPIFRLCSFWTWEVDKLEDSVRSLLSLLCTAPHALNLTCNSQWMRQHLIISVCIGYESQDIVLQSIYWKLANVFFGTDKLRWLVSMYTMSSIYCLEICWYINEGPYYNAVG